MIGRKSHNARKLFCYLCWCRVYGGCCCLCFHFYCCCSWSYCCCCCYCWSHKHNFRNLTALVHYSFFCWCCCFCCCSCCSCCYRCCCCWCQNASAKCKTLTEPPLPHYQTVSWEKCLLYFSLSRFMTFWLTLEPIYLLTDLWTFWHFDWPFDLLTWF